MRTIKLQARGGEPITVDVEVARCCLTVKDMIDNLRPDATDDEVIPLQVDHATLEKVIEWVKHHMNDPPAVAKDKNDKEECSDDISAWDAEFLNVDTAMIFKLCNAAYFLNVKGLIELTCKTMANMLKGKTPVEIRKTLNIKNDLNTAEKKENE